MYEEGRGDGKMGAEPEGPSLSAVMEENAMLRAALADARGLADDPPPAYTKAQGAHEGSS